MTASELLLVDGAATTDESEHGSHDGGLHYGVSCYPSKLKADSGRL